MASRNRFKELTRRIMPSGWKKPASQSSIVNGRWGYALAVLSGLMLTASFPDWQLDILAWCAFMPLVYAILRDSRIAFRLGFVAGLAFFWPSLFWLRHVTVSGWLALGTYLALYFAVWAWTIGKLRGRFPEVSGAHHLAIAGLGAAAWVAVEWLRAHLLSGFPWNPLGVSQYRNIPLIQIADRTGVYGVSFLIVFFNLAFFTGIRRMFLEKFSMGKWRYELTAALLLLVLSLISGMKSFWHYSKQPAVEKVRVALVQPNVPQSLKWEESFEKQAREDLKQLTLEAAATQPDLIVWPETALTSGPMYDADAADYLDGIMRELKSPLLAGTIDKDPEKKRVYYNCALLLRPGGVYEPAYRKQHLVPFGEFVPLETRFPILRKLTPITASFGRGEGPQLVVLKPNVTLGILICFEDMFPYLARKSVGDGANLLVNVTNDGWFRESHEQVQHAAAAVFRAVENRVPLARCCNNGYTCIIEPTGVISTDLKDKEHGIYIRGLASADINVPAVPRTFYNRYGDVFAVSCLAVTVVCWIIFVRDFLISRRLSKL